MMDSTIQDNLFETFFAVATTDANKELTRSVTDAARAVQSVGAAFLSIAPITQTAAPSAAAAPATTSSSGSSSGSIVSSVLGNVFGGVPGVGEVTSAISGSGGGDGIVGALESIGKSVLESGLGLVPLIGGLLGLFGGGGSATPPPLVKYAMPAKLGFQGAESGTGIGDVDYDQMGMPRSYDGLGSSMLAASGLPTGGSSSATRAVAPAPAASPQITVNVQAMDARSFLDRSSDIAAAVRDAMLSLNPINDVVNDL
jgi:hypothetical protein